MGADLGVRGLGMEARSLGKTCSGKGGREQIPTGARDQPGSLGGRKTAPGASPAGPLGWERRRGAQPFSAKWGALPGELPLGAALSRHGDLGNMRDVLGGTLWDSPAWEQVLGGHMGMGWGWGAAFCY